MAPFLNKISGLNCVPELSLCWQCALGLLFSVGSMSSTLVELGDGLISVCQCSLIDRFLVAGET